MTGKLSFNGCETKDVDTSIPFSPLFKIKLHVERPSNMLLLYIECFALGTVNVSNMIDYYRQTGKWNNLTFPNSYIKSLYDSDQKQKASELVNSGCAFKIKLAPRNLLNDGQVFAAKRLLIKGNSYCLCINPSILPYSATGDASLKAARCFDRGCSGSGIEPKDCGKTECEIVYSWINSTDPAKTMPDGGLRSFNEVKYDQICGKEFVSSESEKYNKEIAVGGVPLIVIITTFIALLMKNKGKTKKFIIITTVIAILVLSFILWFISTEMGGINKCSWNEEGKPGKSICYSKRLNIPIKDSNCLFKQHCECHDQSNNSPGGIDCLTLSNCTTCSATTCVNSDRDRSYEIVRKKDFNTNVVVLCILFAIFSPLLVYEIYKNIGKNNYVILFVSIIVPILYAVYNSNVSVEHIKYVNSCPVIDKK